MTETALVTGASGGIGYELARKFAEDGYDLVIVARSEDKLEKIADEFEDEHGVSVTVLPKDLSVPGAPDELYDEVADEDIEVNFLVNNAGIGTHGRFHESDLNGELDLLNLNVVTPTHLTRRFLNDMVGDGGEGGKILNVASTAAFQPGPLMATYYASKAYLLWFSEGIKEELKGEDVTVTALCPGPVDTGFQERADMEESNIAKGSLQDPVKVAEAGYNGMMKGKTMVIPGMRYKILPLLVRLTPRRVTRKIAMRINRSSE